MENVLTFLTGKLMGVHPFAALGLVYPCVVLGRSGNYSFVLYGALGVLLVALATVQMFRRVSEP